MLPAAPAFAQDNAPATISPTTSARPASTSPSAVVVIGRPDNTVTLGPLGAQSTLDTPFSVNTVSSEAIENMQAATTSAALQYNSTVHATLGSNLASNYFVVRGFQISPFGTNSSATVDGMRAAVLFEPVEDKADIQVLNGPASFLYGFTSPGGLVNYALKRPTATPMANVTVGDYGGAQAYVHADLGGPIGNGTFGYRLNLLGVDHGNVGLTGESNARYLVSGAVDWHLSPDTLLSFDASHFRRKIEGQQTIFVLGAGVTAIPAAPRGDVNYGVPYAFTNDSYSRSGVQFSSKLSDVFSVRAAFRYTSDTNSDFNLRSNLIDNAGNYTFSAQVKGTNRLVTWQEYAFLDADFRTGPFSHKVTLGVTNDYGQARLIYPNGNVTYTYPATYTASITHPAYPPNPNYPLLLGNGPMLQSEATTLRNWLVSDRIGLGQAWTLMLGASLPSIHDTNWNANTGALSSDYRARKVGPTAGLIFKPLANVSLYTSYINALQAGPTAPIGTANQYQVLPPYNSSQIEAGAKAVLGAMNANLALFRISKPYTYTDAATNLYSLNGQEVHQGGEFTFTGKVSGNLTLNGGVTLMDAKVTRTSTPSLFNKVPMGVPDTLATLYAEYATPPVPGLILTAGFTYTGGEWIDAANTLAIPSVPLVNLGLRYTLRRAAHPVTFRLTVDNVGGRNYWTNKGDGTQLYPGNPRTAAFSVQFGL